MSPAAVFLNALAHAFSSVGLYGEGHPARVRSLDVTYRALEVLMKETVRPTFSFLHGQVVYEDQPLREMRDWPLAERFARRKIERIEFTRGVTREELNLFLVRLAAGGGAEERLWSSDSSEFRFIRFGPLMMGDEEQHSAFNLNRQMVRVDELYDEALRKGRLSGTLARTVVDTIALAMRSESKLLVPLVPLKEADQYTTVHSMNTSVLSMALGEFIRLAGPEVRMVGEAALLHDVGKVMVPTEILTKPERLNEKEWEYIKRHPIDGARILMRSGEGLELAAIAAYEHHLRPDGTGYPELSFPRKPHRISQLIHLCDAYDAMRTTRPFQEAMPHGRILKILVEGAGKQYALDLVKGFITMLKEWESRMVIADGEESVPEAE